MTQTHSHLFPGVPFAIAAAVLFGISAPLSKELLDSVDPWLLAGLLYLGAGIGLALVRLGQKLTGASLPETHLTRADMPRLALVALLGGGIGPLFLMFGLARTSAATGSLLLNLEAVATLGIAWIVFRENVDRRLLIGAVLIIAGAVILTWSGSGLTLDFGAVLIAAACLAWGLDNNLSRGLSAADPVEVVIVKGLVAGGTNVALGLWLGAQVPGLAVIAAGAVTGFLGIGVSLVCYMLALRHLGAARSGAYFALAPFIGAAFAIVAFKAPLTAEIAIVGLLMGIGLWLHLSERHDHTHHHGAQDHDHLHVHDAHHDHPHGPGIDPSEPHSHPHHHAPMTHRHAHYPDLHHRHDHG